MDEDRCLAIRFEENRSHLRGVAYRMLGSATEAEDALQETWLRLSRAETSDVQNLGGWLTTVMARVCLDLLRARKARREEPWDPHAPDHVGSLDEGSDPEREALLADSVGQALLRVLDTLVPVERVAFVLHDLFGVPFDEIAPILGRSPAATRQLASRGRRRVQGTAAPGADRARQREVVSAFLTASRAGDFEALLALLDPDVVLRADAVAVRVAAANRGPGAPDASPEVRGARTVAEFLGGRARGAQAAAIDGEPSAAWVQRGQARGVFLFTVEDDRIVELDVIMDPVRLATLHLVIE